MIGSGLKATNKIASIATTFTTVNPTSSALSKDNITTHALGNGETALPISRPTRGLGSSRSSGSLTLTECRVSGSQRMSLGDVKALLGTGRLSSCKRKHNELQLMRERRVMKEWIEILMKLLTHLHSLLVI